MNVRALFRQAWAALRTGGQRTVVAVLCIAFGIGTLVGMLLLTRAIQDAVTVSPRLKAGAELMIPEGGPGRADSLGALVAQGVLTRWTPASRVPLNVVQPSRAGGFALAARGRAVDPEVFPLVGWVELAGGQTLREALAQPEAVVLSQDVAWQAGVAEGDTVRLSAMGGLTAVRKVVRGIVTASADLMGSSVYLSREALADGLVRPDETVFLATAPRPADALEHLPPGSEVLDEAAPLDRSMAFFLRLLRGAGLLGLVVGGLGVANTLAVLLAGRATEIAVRKTLGYRGRDLFLLFGTEAALLGVLGGLLGVGLGWGLAAGLLSVLSRSLPFLAPLSADGLILGIGVLGGVVTALLFGTMPIVRAASVRPASLLRGLPERASAAARAVRGGLVALLVVLGWLGASLVMGGLLPGAAVAGVVAGGFVVFGGGLYGLLYLATRLPLPGMPLGRVAQRNAVQRPAQTTFALIAFFVGFFAIGISLASFRNASAHREGRATDRSGFNVSVVTAPADGPGVRAALEGAGADSVVTRYFTMARWAAGSAGDAGEPVRVEADATLRPGTIHLARRDATPGDTVRIAFGDTVRTYTVAARGARQTSREPLAMFAQPAPSAYVPFADLASRAEARVGLMAHVAPGTMGQTARGLTEGHAGRAVMTVADVDAFLDMLFLALFRFAIAVASLALVAGAVLIANGVTLALVERRREVGVLKSLGYHRRHILRILAYEYGGMGVLAAGVALAAVAATLWLVQWQSDRPVLGLGLPLTALLVGVAVAVPVAAVYAAGWRAAGKRPLDMLRLG